MAINDMSRLIQHLRTVLRPDKPRLSDGQLLTCFIEKQDADAFATLVQRHGPMVLGVCRRVLRNDHDADDCFQATFLVLASKAASVSPRERVANWLFGVARTTALRARSLSARRWAKEKQVREMPEPATK